MDTFLKALAVTPVAARQHLRKAWPVRRAPWVYGLVGGVCIAATWAVQSSRYAALVAEQATLHARLERQAAEIHALQGHGAPPLAHTPSTLQALTHDSRSDMDPPAPPPVDPPLPTAALKEQAVTLAQRLIDLTTDWIRQERTASVHAMAVRTPGIRAKDHVAVTYARERAAHLQTAFLSVYHRTLQADALRLRTTLRARLPATGGPQAPGLPLATYEHPVTYEMLDAIAMDLLALAHRIR